MMYKGNMALFIAMLLNIEAEGVDTPAYINFVEYTVNQLNPADSAIGATYANTLTVVTKSIVLVVLLLILVVFIIVIMFFALAGHMTPLHALCAIIVAVALLAVYFAIISVYALSVNNGVIPIIQNTLVKTVGYTANSLLRDTIYLLLCE